MSRPRRIVPLTLSTLLACQGDPIADPSSTGVDSDGETATTTGTTATATQDPTSEDPTSTGSTGDPTTGGSTSATATGDTTTSEDSTGGDTTGAPEPSCGDGHTDPGEACDNGPQNGDDQACTAACTINVCGDGKQGPGEGCDDGNLVDDDECSAKCSLPGCGDGHVGVGEACDDGNLDDTDECTAACTAAACGDSFIQPANGEACDDGAGNNEAAACTPECLTATCGDGYVLQDVEECDDGAENGDDQACTAACAINVCGDGKLGPQEACDDGNLLDDDGCSAACEPAPEATTLKLKFSQIKHFDFSWAAATGATFYQLLESPTKDAPYVQLGGDIVGQSISPTMPLHLRFGARYVLRACNDGGCTDSAPVEVASTMASAVGYLKATNAGPEDYFGVRVALSSDGKTLAVSAQREASLATGINGDQTDNTGAVVGAVYIFVRTNDGWSQQAYIKASNAGTGDLFGEKVALSADGNTLAVSAANEDSAATGINGDQASNAASDSGAVYVFVRANEVWSQQAYLKASNTEKVDFFGGSVGLSHDGNTLAVGAYVEDSAATGIGGDQASNAAVDSGAAYVFVRANGIWSQQAYIKPSNTGAGDIFGYALALSGDGTTLAVGARLEDSAAIGIDGDQANNAAANAGALYVFVRANDVWSQQAYIKPSNTDAGDFFAIDVALSKNGDTLVAGAFLEDSAATGVDGDQADNTAGSAGAAYVFVRANGAWSQQAYLKASNTEAGDQLGDNLALSADGNMLAVDAQSEDGGAPGVGGQEVNNAAADSGAVYLFERANDVWSQRAYIKASNPGPGDRFRWAALSGDGQTLAVGAWSEDSAATGIGGKQSDNTASNAGAVYLY